GDFFIDVEHAGGDELPLALHALHLLAGNGAGKIAPDHGGVLHAPVQPRGDLARAGERKVPVQRFLAGDLGLLAVVKNVERVKIGVLRVDAVAGKPAAQAVAPVVHQRDGVNNRLAAEAFSAFVDDPGDRAAG